MIKVSKIQGVSTRSFSHSPNNKQVAFGCSQAIKNAVKDELISSSKSLKFLNYINKKKGEILNVTVNAIGTGLVAPFFIAFNPISKEDKDTKAYSALRQPVSALLSVITQVGINTQFNKYINNLAKKGEDGLGSRYDISLEAKDKFDNAVKVAKDKLIANGMDAEHAADKALKSVNKQLAKAKKRLTAFKAVAGIGLSLAIMPFTCSALNWLYPRMVELLAPSLCKDNGSAAKGGK